MRFVGKSIDYLNKSIEEWSIKRLHIFFMFYILGAYLVLLPLLNIIKVSVEVETIIGNYTNIISAGVSLLTLAEAKRIRNEAQQHKKEIQQKFDQKETPPFEW